MIREGGNINEINSKGESLLRRSLYQGNLPYIKILVKHNALIIPPLSFNQTVLHLAVFLENIELVE